jgi:DNA polymerase-3 subunit delta
MKTLDTKIKHVYLLSGEETFYIDKAREKIFSKLQVEKSEITILDCNEKIPISEIINTIDSAPFFNPKNVVFVKNAPFFSAENKFERLEKTLSNMLPTNYVIFTTRNADKRRKLYKLISKVGEILEADPLKAWEVDKWLDEKLKSIGKTIRFDARNYFNERIAILPEISIWYLENEFDKISLNVKGKEITLTDLQKNLLEMPEVPTFAIIDAIDAKKIKYAVSILRTQLSNKNNFVTVITVLSRHIRQLLLARFYLSKKISGNVLAQKLEMHPYIAKKFEKTAGTYNSKLLEEIFLELAAADFNFKIGRAGVESLERIVIKLCRR